MELIQKIKKILKKKNERIILDLCLKDYDRSNFYFALVFNEKIEKFKVLYVPIDAIGEKGFLEEYFCYQFVFVDTVNYVLENISKYEDKFGDWNFRDKCSKKMNSYYVEMNVVGNNEEYKFTFSQFLDEEFYFLFDIIVVLFEHLPNIVSELCKKLLVAFDDSSDPVKYDNTYDFDLFDGDLVDLFSSSVIDNCRYEFSDISFLESVGNRYYGVINDKLIVIDYLLGKKIFNIASSPYETLGEEVYIIVKAIREHFEKKFYRLQVALEKEELINESAKYYLCYGIEDDYFKVVNEKVDDMINLDFVRKECIKIMNCDERLETRLREYLSEKYEDKKVDEIINYTVMR